MTTKTAEQQAYELGCEHARNAASWVIDANGMGADAAGVARILRMLDNGDPAVDDYLPREPHLSGEYADDPTPRSLAFDVMGWDAVISDETVDALADAYMEGVYDFFRPECERILRAAL